MITCKNTTSNQRHLAMTVPNTQRSPTAMQKHKLATIGDKRKLRLYKKNPNNYDSKLLQVKFIPSLENYLPRASILNKTNIERTRQRQNCQMFDLLQF